MTSKLGKMYKGHNGQLTVIIPRSRTIDSYDKELQTIWGQLRASESQTNGVLNFDDSDYAVMLNVYAYKSVSKRRNILVIAGLSQTATINLLNQLKGQFGELVPNGSLTEWKASVVKKILTEGYYEVPPNDVAIKETE